MSWRNAPLLTAIRSEADRLWPGRSRASDGTIGDLAHQRSASDHNPDARGVVHAIDLTNDPAHGLDAWTVAQRLADRCRNGLEGRIKYLVSYDPARRVDVIASPIANWAWRQNGSAKRDHASHLHISINGGPAVENSTAPLIAPAVQAAPPADLPALAAEIRKAKQQVLRRGSRGPAVVWLQVGLNQLGARLATDGEFGQLTEATVRWTQGVHGQKTDGIVGPRFWSLLF